MDVVNNKGILIDDSFLGREDIPDVLTIYPLAVDTGIPTFTNNNPLFNQWGQNDVGQKILKTMFKPGAIRELELCLFGHCILYLKNIIQWTLQ